MDLAVGENAVIVTVTAQDGTTTKEYTLTISRAPDTTAPTVAFASVSENGLTVTVVFNERPRPTPRYAVEYGVPGITSERWIRR